MRYAFLRRALAAVALSILCTFPVGCSLADSQSHGDRGRLEDLADSCDGPLATDYRIDASGTGRSDELRAQRLADVRVEAERVALCGGRLRVVVFSASTVASRALFDGPLEAAGHTEGARLRKVAKTVDPAMADIEAAWDDALRTLPEHGSDIVGQFTAASEYFAQHPDRDHRLVIVSDGMQTDGPFRPDATTTVDEAAAVAASMTAPRLDGVAVVVAGIGRTADEPPSTTFVEVLDRFFTDFCTRTEATCLVVTDLSAN